MSNSYSSEASAPFSWSGHRLQTATSTGLLASHDETLKGIPKMTKAPNAGSHKLPKNFEKQLPVPSIYNIYIRITYIYIYLLYPNCICKSSARMSQEMLRFFVCSCFFCSTKQNLARIARMTSCHQWCPNSALSQNRILTVPSKGLGILMISSWKKWWLSPSWCIELGSESDFQILLKNDIAMEIAMDML